MKPASSGIGRDTGKSTGTYAETKGMGIYTPRARRWSYILRESVYMRFVFDVLKFSQSFKDVVKTRQR